ncbi:hypothetical protein PGB90_002919 [Kerria lacca]
MTYKIKFPKNELNFNYTFNGGQAFRWKCNENNIWTGVYAHCVWTIWQDENYIFYDVKSNTDSKIENSETLLKDYFRLNESLSNLYGKWAKCDPIFENVAKKFTGVRMLKQDPIENIFTFICSSNNNITRIKSMVEKMCTFYGTKIATVNGTNYYDFPSVENLANITVINDLQKAAFGYRAKYIQQAASKIIEFGGIEWILQLQSLPYKKAKIELMKLPGIGAKVADCICLMSLDHLEAIPVDTHVFQIATKYYLPHLKNVKSVTDRIYNEIGDHFRSLYGKYAGWPHCVLFCRELKTFQEKSKEKHKKTTKKRKLEK